jgi:hypothetical protein
VGLVNTTPPFYDRRHSRFDPQGAATAMLEKVTDQLRQLRQTDSLMWLITLGHTFTHWCPATFYLLLPFLVKEMGLTLTPRRAFW